VPAGPYKNSGLTARRGPRPETQSATPSTASRAASFSVNEIQLAKVCMLLPLCLLLVFSSLCSWNYFSEIHASPQAQSLQRKGLWRKDLRSAVGAGLPERLFTRR
jgi:hypothetical protein